VLIAARLTYVHARKAAESKPEQHPSLV